MMRAAWRGLRLALLLDAALLAPAFAAALHLEGVRPPPLPPGEGPPPPGPSYVALQIALPLAHLRDALDRSLPRELRRPTQVDTAVADEGDLEGEAGERGKEGTADRDWLGRPVRWRGVLRREPIELHAHGDSLIATATISYSIEALERELGSARCGTVSQPLHGQIGCATRLGWSDAWTLDTRARSLPTEYASGCKPDPPGIDFTRRINNRVDAQLVSVLPARFDSVVRATTDLSKHVRAALSLLAQPVMLGDSTAWLHWNVQRVLVDPPRVDGDSIVTRLAFESRPEIATGPGEPDRPLPYGEPRVRLSGNEIQIPFDCWVDYSDLARGIVGVSAAGPAPGDSVRVLAARLSGGRDRLVIALDLSGAVSGTVYLAGTLSAVQRLYVLQSVDLDWSPESRAALRAAAGRERWSDLESALGRLRSAVRAKITRTLNDCVIAWDRELNRALQPVPGAALSLRGGFSRRNVQTIFCTDRAIGVRLVAIGRARLLAR